MTDIVERRSKDNCVICPACNHEFVAVPVDVQEEIASLRQQLAECQAQNAKLSERVVGVGEIAINSVSRDRLAECQAREKVLRDALNVVCEYVPDKSTEGDKDSLLIDNALALPSDSTALDTMLKAAKREALLEARELLLRSCPFGSNPQAWYVNEIEQKAKELE